MPIDPSIALQNRPAQIAGPLEAYSQLLGLQQQQQQTELQKQSLGALAEQRQAQTQQSQLKLQAAQQQQATEEAAMNAIAQIKGGNRDEVVGSIQDPKVRQMASEWLLHEDEFKSKMQSAKLENIRRGAQMIQAAGYDPVVARTVLGLKEEDYPEAKQIWETFGSDPDKFKQTIDQLSRAGEKPAENFTLAPGAVRFDGQGHQIAAAPREEPKPIALGPNSTLVNPQTGSVVATAPPAPVSDAQRLADDRATAAQAEAARHNRAMEARPVAGAGSGVADDAKEIAGAIMRGEQPPDTTGLARNGMASAVRTELAKNGYNLAMAKTDWNATQKHIATLNGSQQTRLRQSVDNAAHSLDVIEDLAKQWDAGGFRLLNKARLVSAKEGALGEKAQTLATRLDSQIADVTSELGNVYMGGNSPTDHALSLAAKNLSADWSRETLTAMLNQARKNLQIRANSMVNVGVAGASDTNPYAGGAGQTAAPAKSDPLGIR